MFTHLTLGKTRRKKKVTLTTHDRATHMHVVGDSGKGKTKFLEGLIRQDIAAGRGLCLIDPENTLYQHVLEWCAANRRVLGTRKIHLIDPSVDGWTFGFNPFQRTADVAVSVTVDAMVNACAQVWGGEDQNQTPRLKRCLRALFYCLFSQELTLVEAIDLISAADPQGLRRYLTANIPDRVIRTEWESFNAKSPREFNELFESTTNRLMEFLTAPSVRAILGQQRGIDFRQCMDNGDVVLVNLNAPRALSPFNARLLGTLIVNDLYMKALDRPEGSKNFYLYIDECYDFLNADTANILDRTRKRGLHSILAHQRLGQLREAGDNIYNAVMGQAQTKVVFGINDADDAKALAENIFMGELNLNQTKPIFDKPVVVDYEVEWLSSMSSSEGESYTLGTSTGGGETEGTTFIPTDDGYVEIASSGSSSFSSDSSSHTETHIETKGQHQSLRPVLKMMPTQGKSFQEVVYEATARLSMLRKRTAIVKVPNRHSVMIRTSDISATYVTRETVAAFVDENLHRNDFARPLHDVEQELEERGARLSKEAALALGKTEPESFKEPIRE